MLPTINYANVQCIAYHLFTSTPFSTRYTRVSLDTVMRMDAIFDIMQYCAKQPGIDTRPTTLKIFVAPEFYGRSFSGQPDGTGHYITSHVLQGFAHLKKVCMKDERFRDWLVIPGTFVSAEEIGQQRVIFNSIYAFKGDGSISRILHKKFFSSYDQLNFRARAKAKIQFGLKDIVTKPSALIVVGNVSIGIEICKDYLEARLRLSLEKKMKTMLLKVSDGVDVQVLTACGMRWNERATTATDMNDRVAVKNAGHFFRVDGDQQVFDKNKGLVPGTECLTLIWEQQPTMLALEGQIERIPQEVDIPDELQINPSGPTKSFVAIFPALPKPA